MCEKTFRKKLKENDCCLKISTEKYTNQKCYRVIDENGNILFQDNDLDDLIKSILNR